MASKCSIERDVALRDDSDRAAIVHGVRPHQRDAGMTVFRVVPTEELFASFGKSMNDVEKTLTRRQIECLEMVARGSTSAEIALALRVSRRTIDHYVANTCARLGVRNRTQAVAKAIVDGLIERPK